VIRSIGHRYQLSAVSLLRYVTSVVRKIRQNKPKLHWFQFYARYGDNVCMFGRVFWVG